MNEGGGPDGVFCSYCFVVYCLVIVVCFVVIIL